MATKKSKRSTGKSKAQRPTTATKPAATTSNRDKRHQEKERAKEAVVARKAAEKRRSLLINGVIIGAVVVLVMGLGWYIWNESNKPVVEPAAMTKDYGMVVGEAKAPQKVVIYEDFLCPPCGQVESSVGSLVGPATESGGASVEYRPINQLNTDYSDNAAQAMWAVLDTAGVKEAKAFHDALFAAQPGEQDEHPGESELADIAASAGADRAKVLSALEDNTYEGLVEKATKEAQRLASKMPNGQFSTPTIFINDELQSSASLSDIISRVAGVLQVAAKPAADASATPSP